MYSDEKATKHAHLTTIATSGEVQFMLMLRHSFADGMQVLLCKYSQ